MSTNDDHRAPDHIPAYTKPIAAKEPVEKSPQLSNAELSSDAVVGLMASSRRIAVCQAIDILIRNNADMVDRFEALLKSCEATVAERKAASVA